jgi:predicted DNA-binding transcriptional regulator AlpA
MSKHNDDKTLTSQSDNIPLKEVIKRVGVTKSSIVRWVKKDIFPKPYTLGGRTFFSAKEVDAWIDDKKANRGFNGTPPPSTKHKNWCVKAV